MQYVTRWRMRVAINALQDDGATVAQAADRLGYRSEAAFARAPLAGGQGSRRPSRTRAGLTVQLNRRPSARRERHAADVDVVRGPFDVERGDAVSVPRLEPQLAAVEGDRPV